MNDNRREADLLDSALRPVIDPPLDRIARVALRLGLTADRVTALGFAVGVGAWVALALGEHSVALGAILVNRLADGLDGAVARRAGPTDWGGYLDIVLDFIFYAGVPFAVAVHRPEVALVSCFLVFSFVGTGASFLAYAAVSARRGLAATATPRGPKALRYLGGLTEGTETILFFVLICLVPDYYVPLAWGFGALCWVTTVTRVARSWQAFARPES